MKRVGRHETVRWERDRKCDRFHRRVQGHMKNAGLLRKGWGWEMENRTVALKWKKSDCLHARRTESKDSLETHDRFSNRYVLTQSTRF